MPNISYKTQSFILIVWILVVMALFRFISDRQVAASIAGLGFIVLPTLFLYSEFRSYKRILHIFVLGIFLIAAAMPIFLLRVLNWGSDFSSLDLFGIPATGLHKASNYLYLLMLCSAVYHFLQYRNKNTN